MNNYDSLQATGELKIERFNSEGSIIETREIKNLVVTVGKTFIASRVVGTASAVMSHMSIGSGTATPVVGDTTLGTELGRVALTSGTASSNAVTYIATFPAGTGTGAITEAGIFNAASAGTMLARTKFDVVNKAAGDSIAITWVVTVN